MTKTYWSIKLDAGESIWDVSTLYLTRAKIFLQKEQVLLSESADLLSIDFMILSPVMIHGRLKYKSSNSHDETED